MSRVWINGAVTDLAQARIDPLDRGFLVGDGLFETMRWTQAGLRRGERHRARLEAGLALLGIAPPDWAEVEAAAGELAQAAALEDAVARLSVTRGPGRPGLETEPGDPTVMLWTAPRPAPPGSVRLARVDAPRRNPASLASRAKTIGYADSILARRAARARGADMAVLADVQGRLSCADCATLFWIDTGRVYTPALTCAALPGTARAALAPAARAAGIAVEEVEAEAYRLDAAAAIMVLNATSGLVPASSLDGRPLAVDHPLIRALQDIEEAAL